jgi:hypothetical protein
VDGTLLLDGEIVCGGAPGGDQAGGGSGGSIYLTAGTLEGSGRISADGGDGGVLGGGGGAGRIAVYCGTDIFTGAITGSGGEGFEPGENMGMPQNYLKDAITVLQGLAKTDFKNSQSGKTLINKLDAAIGSIEAGLYQDALMKLQHDLFPKMDGCATTGWPDKNDWIIGCEAQQQVYPLILEAIQLLESLL